MNFQIADLFEIVADTVPSNEAIYDEKHRLTYAQLDERANKLAHYFQSIGVKKGDHIGLYIYNCAEYVEAILAAAKISATTININYRYVDEELRYLLDDAKITTLVFQRDLAPVVARVLKDFPAVTQTVYIEDESEASVANIPNVVEYEAAIAPMSGARDFSGRSPDDHFIVYTGGTTGMPKGVVWRHEDLFFAGLQGGRPQGDPIETPEELREVVASGDFNANFHPAPPFIHGTSQFAAIIGLFAGGKLTIARNRSFDPAQTARLIQEEGINIIVLVGDAMSRPLLDEVRANGDKYDLSSLMVVTSQGAIISRSTIAAFAELMPNTMVLNNFGASETGHQGQALGTNDAEGRPQFFMSEQTVILDEDLNVVEPGSGKVGRLARAGHIPLGYFNDPVKTAETFVEHDGKRWVIPGDFATVDADGLVSLLGRGSICINTGGEKVYPEEVEEALKDHDEVVDVLVVGVPDERWGERVEAVIQLATNSTVDGDALKQHLSTLVAGYKVPKNWHFRDKIERQPSGKPDYRWAKSVALGEA